MGLTLESLATATGLNADAALRWYPHIQETAKRFDFQEPKRLAMWLAQCGHESGGFKRLVENLNYSAEGLTKTWPKRFPTLAAAQSYARQPEKIANRVYASRIGNGDEASGDGWRFRGRGLIQVTGRENYKACGAALGVDLLERPELLETERYAALSAGWFWDSRKLNAPADAGDIEAVTKKINGGTTGLADRKARWAQTTDALA